MLLHNSSTKSVQINALEANLCVSLNILTRTAISSSPSFRTHKYILIALHPTTLTPLFTLITIDAYALRWHTCLMSSLKVRPTGFSSCFPRINVCLMYYVIKELRTRRTNILSTRIMRSVLWIDKAIIIVATLHWPVSKSYNISCIIWNIRNKGQILLNIAICLKYINFHFSIHFGRQRYECERFLLKIMRICPQI